jgi:hypothetical protein
MYVDLQESSKAEIPHAFCIDTRWIITISVASTVNQRSDLDTLPAHGALWRPWIDKSGMRHPLPNTILAIKTLQKQSLVILHAAPIVELLPLIEAHSGRLTRSMRVPVFDGNQIVVVHQVCRGEAQREGLDGSIERAPDIDDTVPAL